MDKKQTRDDTNYLLSAIVEEFDYKSAVDAFILLAEALEDIQFQLNDIPEFEFQGRDYQKWRMGAAYKRNLISAATRRFRFRVKELQCGQ